jgi:hypothetical protein
MRQVCILGNENLSSTVLTPKYGIILELVQSTGVGHIILVDSYFNLLKLFSDTYKRKISACGTVHLSREEVPSDFSD